MELEELFIIIYVEFEKLILQKFRVEYLLIGCRDQVKGDEKKKKFVRIYYITDKIKVFWYIVQYIVYRYIMMEIFEKDNIKDCIYYKNW